MKKLTAIVLVFSILFSMIVVPMGVTATETDRFEMLSQPTSTRIDIFDTLVVPNGKTANKVDMFKNPVTFGDAKTEGAVYNAGSSDATVRGILNAYKLGFKRTVSPTITDGSKFDRTDILNIEAKGYEVVAEGNATGTKAKLENGVWTTGLEETYQTKYYKVPADYGYYTLGPVAVEDNDATTDVFLSYNGIYLGTQFKVDGTREYNYNGNKFENINLSGDYLNVMIYTGEAIEGDANFLPIKVTYKTGESVTYYALITNNNITARGLQNIVKVAENKEGEYTETQLKSVSQKLTVAYAEEIGVSADATIKDIKFATATTENVVIPTKKHIGDLYVSQTSGTTKYTNYMVADITIPLDSSREVASISFNTSQTGADVDAIVAPHDSTAVQKATAYRKVTIDGYEGNYEFFVNVGRNLVGKNILLGMSVTAAPIVESINKINEQLAEANTEEEVKNALAAKMALINSSNGAIVSSDFDSTLAEAGLASPVIHDKYSLCHGRTTLSYHHDNSLIHLNRNAELDKLYQEELPQYYNGIITLDSKYEDPILDDFYLTYQTMLLSKKMAELKGRDLSRMDYSPVVKKLYRYNGQM